MRDQRLDPMPRDIVRVKDEIRTFIDGPSGTGQFIRYKVKGRGNRLFDTTLGMWRKWASTGEVISPAGEAA